MLPSDGRRELARRLARAEAELLRRARLDTQAWARALRAYAGDTPWARLKELTRDWRIGWSADEQPYLVVWEASRRVRVPISTDEDVQALVQARYTTCYGEPAPEADVALQAYLLVEYAPRPRGRPPYLHTPRYWRRKRARALRRAAAESGPGL